MLLDKKQKINFIARIWLKLSYKLIRTIILIIINPTNLSNILNYYNNNNNSKNNILSN